MLNPPMMVGEYAFADVIDPRYGQAPKCPSCGAYLGMRKWLAPHRVRLVKGMKSFAPGDIIDGPGCEAMMSERFIAEYERANLKGIERWEPVTIEGYNNYWEKKLKRPAPAEQYRIATFPRPMVRAKWDLMHPRPLPGTSLNWIGCDVCGRHPSAAGSYRGIVVDDDSWNGADIFQLTNFGGCFVVTEAFAKFVAESKLSGIPLVPTAKYRPFRAPRATW